MCFVFVFVLTLLGADDECGRRVPRQHCTNACPSVVSRQWRPCCTDLLGSARPPTTISSDLYHAEILKLQRKGLDFGLKKGQNIELQFNLRSYTKCLNCAHNHPLSDVSLVCKHWRPQEAINSQKTLVDVAKRHNMPTAGADNEGFPRGVQHLHWAQLSLLTISPLLYFDFDFGSAPANHQHHHAKDSLLELAVV